MPNFFQRTLNPAGFHGGKKGPFFEGWYFKLVNAQEDSRFAIIPGVSLSGGAGEQHAFIQVMDGARGVSTYHTFPIEAFSAAPEGFDVRIGRNRFRLDSIQLDIAEQEGQVRGELQFANPAPRGWPVGLLSPGIMGWYAWVPWMECYHGVLSFDHGLQGQIAFNGQAVDFTGGRGYTEKDWGRSFPVSWVWMQSNHFVRRGVCLTASLAMIPWVGTAFPGFIVGVWDGTELFRFATYNGTRITKLEIGEETLDWQLDNRSHRLELLAHRAQGSLLHAPTLQGMDRKITETMDGRIWMRLSERTRAGWKTLLEDEGHNAGMEAVGDLQNLRQKLAMFRKR